MPNDLLLRVGVTWVPVFKAGSTTWKRFLMSIQFTPEERERPGEDPWRLKLLEPFRLTQRNMVAGPRRREFRTEGAGSPRFTVVRHPMSRLVSHYYKTRNHPIEVAFQWDDWVVQAISRNRPAANISQVINQSKRLILVT